MKMGEIKSIQIMTSAIAANMITGAALLESIKTHFDY